eukprot:2106906-Prymnesium_polylepis.1
MDRGPPAATMAWVGTPSRAGAGGCMIAVAGRESYRQATHRTHPLTNILLLDGWPPLWHVVTRRVRHAHRIALEKTVGELSFRHTLTHVLTLVACLGGRDEHSQWEGFALGKLRQSHRHQQILMREGGESAPAQVHALQEAQQR